MNMTGKILLSTAAVLAFSSSAMAADLMVPAAPAPVVAAPSTNWDGPYIGANVGYGWLHSDHNDITTSIGDFDMGGAMAGAQIGYNFHVADSVVLGVQADIDWASIKGNDATFTNIAETVNWTGAVTGRLGVEVDSVLPYALVGVAFANGTRTGINGTTTDSQTHTGWTAGVGVEAMVADNLSVFAEYRYTDYGSRTYAVPSTPGVDLAGSSVRVGLNYHF